MTVSQGCKCSTSSHSCFPHNPANGHINKEETTFIKNSYVATSSPFYMLFITHFTKRGVEWNINKSILCLAINHWILLVMHVDFTVTLVSIPNAERQILFSRNRTHRSVFVCFLCIFSSLLFCALLWKDSSSSCHWKVAKSKLIPSI